MKARWMAGTLAVMGMVAGQTQVNVKNQTKNVNLSGASFVIPFPTGTALPALCTTGSMFFNLSAPAGSNLAGCVATNTWTTEGGGSSGGGAVSGAVNVQQSSSTTLTIGASCTPSAPCLVQIGSIVYTYTGAALVTLTSGTGLVYLYVDTNGIITAGESSAGSPVLSCSACVLASAITQFPPGVVPLATWSASGGAWIAGTNDVALQSGGPAFIAGTNVTLTQTGNTVTIAASLEALPTGAQPACALSTGGFMWYSPGATGVKDSVQVCAKDATNTYAWRTLY
jgi:hypothetical protein